MSSLWVPALRAGVPLLRAGCWLQCGLDVLDNKGMPFHKIEEQIGDIPKPNLCHFKICKINLTFNLFIYVTILI